MALIKRKKSATTNNVNIKFDKLCLCIVILSSGLGRNIIKLFEKMNVSTSLILKGEGTAQPGLYDLLGLKDNSKDVVIGVIRLDKLEEIKYELNLYFLSNKKNKGVATIIDLSSVVGGLAYRFLSDQF